MHKDIIKWILLVVFLLLATFIFAETAVRLCGHYDVDGDFFVRGFRVYPYHLPAHSLKEKIDRYLAAGDSVLEYDSILGWAPRPNSRSQDGKYFYNDSAIRVASSESLTPKSPQNDVLRIAIFGDSFTLGDNPFQDTWGYHLEEELRKSGINAEVLNFGVGGYGMDQAFLRWKETGYAYAPNIVIFGLQLENMNRNANVVRAIYFKNTGIPFSKPRFILEGDKLKLINSPTVSPHELPRILNDFNSWQFSKYEYWFEPKKYQKNVLFHSKLAAFVYSVINDRVRKRKARTEYLASLSLKIVLAFKEDVEKSGGRFYVVYLPGRQELRLLSKGKKFPTTAFLKEIEKSMPLIHPEERFFEEMKKSDLKSIIPGHYSARANKIIANAIADYILKQEAE
ncbi:MAG: hypothetical protein AMJ95_04700 [Omnitrophica WOR_2 bacterium SM23_72]|nr:MAG: hypothetical protein AMJ95_04700 [Omnitrophica WOR_2 bacterium SM23_72]